MRDNVKALSKIKFQIKKNNPSINNITEDKRLELASGILSANMNSDSIVIDSEMPTDFLGVKLEWNEGKANI